MHSNQFNIRVHIILIFYLYRQDDIKKDGWDSDWVF